MKKLFNLDKKTFWPTAIALFTTFVWAGFIVVSLFSMLSLRGTIDLQPWADVVLGTAQGAYGLIALGLIIFQAQINNNDKK